MEKRRRIEGETHLPEVIIQQIQSLLSAKEAARTTILSKSWYTARLTRPNPDFSDLDIAEPHVLLKLAKETMQKYEESYRKIQSFRLRMDDCRWNNICMFKELIVKAMKLGTTDLDIELCVHMCDDFVLPREVLESETLVRLSARNCEIDLRDQKVNCPGLKYLSLNSAYIQRNTFSDIISMCPEIEELILSECELVGYEKLDSKPVLDVYTFNKLKVLSLNGVIIGRIGKWIFSDFSSGFPCLKDLSLEGDIGYKVRQIRSNSLECISFTKTSVLKAKFDVPRIRKFKFVGLCVPSLSFKTTPRESDISFMIDTHTLKTSWFLKLSEFLLNLSPSKISLYLSMKVYCNWYVRDVTGLPTPPIVVENLRLMICAPYSPRRELLDDLFWWCCPTFITLYRLPVQNKANNDFTELLCKTLRKESGEKQSMSVLHDLQEVTNVLGMALLRK